VQIVSKFFSFILLLFLPTLNFAMEYKILDAKKEPERFKKISYDKIPLTLGEKVLITKANIIFDSIVCLLQKDYQTVKEKVREMINKNIGIESESIEIRTDYFNSLYEARAENIIKDIKTLGVNLNKFEEYTLRSKKYNLIEKFKAYSIVEVKIINGKDIFNKTSTIIVISRKDHWKDWMQEWHTRIILPFKIMTDERIITENELNFIQKLGKELNITNISYHIPNTFYDYLSLEILKELKAELKKYSEQ